MFERIDIQPGCAGRRCYAETVAATASGVSTTSAGEASTTGPTAGPRSIDHFAGAMAHRLLRSECERPGILAAMAELLRFDGTIPHDPAIDHWFADDPTGLRASVLHWFDTMRQSGDNVLEVLHDGFPYVCLGDVPFAYVNAFTAHANVGFVYGAELDDPAGLLEGTGRLGRHVKLRPGTDIDSDALVDLIATAHADMVLRVEALDT